MELTAKTVKITAPSDVYHWGGCFAENGLFLILEVTGDETKPAVIRGREILELVLTKFADAKQRNWATLGILLDLVKDKNEVGTFTVGLLYGSIIYLGNYGSGEILMERKKQTGKILSSNETSSGHAQIGDKLLFSSKTFLSVVEEEKRHKLLTIEEEQEEVVEGLSVLLNKSETAGAAALCITIAEQKQAIEFPIYPLSILKRKSLSGIHRIKNKIGSYMRPDRVESWEDEEEKRHKKIFLTVAVILTGLLLVSIFFNIGHTRSVKSKQRLSQVFDLVSHQFDEAAGLIDLNPARSRVLLSDSKLSLIQILKEFPKNSDEYKEINEWLSKIAEKEVQAYKIFKLTAVPVFFDITLLKEGGVGSQIRGFQETKVILDTKNKLLYSLATDSKKTAIIAGSEAVKDTRALAVHGKNAYILNSDGIVAIDIANKQSRAVIKNDEKWGEIISIEAFGGNVYLLDRKNNAVWKYIATDTGFLTRQNYLNPDVRANFNEAQGLVIDGSVWVSLPNAILKFDKGLAQAFDFKDFSDTLSAIAAISTSDENKYLYLLDKASSRIVVFDKEGTYRAQYQWDDLKNADDFVATEEEGKIFILIGSKIYAIDLK